MALRRLKKQRRGTTAVESAIVLIVFVVLVIGMLDLSIAGFRYHLVANAAREGSRKASVHGSLATSSMGVWGPTSISGTGASTGPFFDVVRPFLIGLDNSDTSILAEWLDNSNARGKRVRVTITTTYRPIMISVFGDVTWNLQGKSTAVITH